MVYLFRFFLVLFFLVPGVHLHAQQEQAVGILTQSDPADKTTWHLTGSDGFTLIKHNKKNVKEVVDSPEVRITIKAGKLYCDGKKVTTDRLLIVPNSGSITFNEQQYSGLMMVALQDDHYVLIHLGNVRHEDADRQAGLDTGRGAEQPIKSSRRRAKDCTVRVMLEEKEELRTEPWVLQSSQGFTVSDPCNASEKKQIASSKLVITVKRDGMIYLNNKPFYEGQIFIQPHALSSIFNGNEYRGPMWIVADENGVKIINCIGLEDYVESVLCTESWPGWPLEVNKVFAIASRTYVIAMVQRAKASNCLYHVRNTNKHQTYSGGTAPDVIKQAVKETEGVFLTYKNQPITAMFDACCGGIITAKMSGFNFSGSPYLARNYACKYCKGCRMYAWHARYPVQEFIATLKNKDGISVRKIRDIRVNKTDKAGIVKEVLIKGATHNHFISAKKIYSLFSKKVKSLSFTVEKKGDTIIFKGNGLGHQVGLCQWGAREMVRLGFDYKSILDFYYPGTQLMRLV